MRISDWSSDVCSSDLQEGDVGERVLEAEGVVELQAVEHPGTVIEAEDVVGQKIAVAVAGAPLGHPLLEQRSAAGEVAIRPGVDRGERTARHETPGGLLQAGGGRVTTPVAGGQGRGGCRGWAGGGGGWGVGRRGGQA